MRGEVESLKRQVRDLARLARAPRPPSPPGVGDLLVTAGLAAVAVKTWDHREELVGALDDLLTETEAVPPALTDGHEAPAEDPAAGPAPADSPADLWSMPAGLMRYAYVDFGADDDLG